MNIGASGKYKLVVRNEDMSIKHETDWFDNIITATGLDALMSGANTVVNYLGAVAGSGNTAPALTNTSLVSYLGACPNYQQITSSSNTVSSPYSVTKTITFRSNQGGVVGNVAEVGVALGQTVGSSSTLISRSLVVDSNGNPTTVAVQSNEYLDVIWSFSLYFAQSSGSFNMNIDGANSSFSYNIIPSNINTTGKNGGWVQNSTSQAESFANIFPVASNDAILAYNSQTLGAITSKPTGTASTGIPSVTSAAYATGSYNRSHTIKFGLNDANFNIGSFMFSLNLLCVQMSINPSVVKTNTKEFSITLNLSVANYTP